MKLTKGDYPAASLGLREEGTVRIRYLVEIDGSISECSVTRSSGKPNLDDAACTLARKYWKFSPATQNGQPITQYVESSVDFRVPG